MTIRSVLRRALFGLAVVSLALHTGDAAAAKKSAKGKAKAAASTPAKSTSAKKKNIALGAFTGNKTKEIRGWVHDALESEFTVTDAEDFKPKNNAAGYEKMATDLGVDAVIVGKVEKQKLTLTIRGSDGEIIKDLVVKAPRGPRLKRAIEGGVPPAVGKSLSAEAEEEEAEEEEEKEEAPPPPPKKKPEPKEEKPEEPAEEEGETGDAEPTETEEEKPAEEEESQGGAAPKGDVGVPFVAGVGVRFMNRKLSFNDTLTELNPSRPLAYEAYIMRDYELRLDPVVYLHLQLYPGVILGGKGFITNIGIVGGFEQGIPITSNYAGQLPNVPKELTNNTQEWFVGSRLRFPGESSEIGVTGTYGKHSFILEGDEKFPIVPDTAYSYIRLGGDVWFSLGKFFVGAEVGLRAVLGTGELESFWFENAAGNGIDVGLRMGFELTRTFSLVAGADMVRYGFDFNPIDKATATRVAGGAIDQYLSGFVGARVVFGGESSKGFGLNSAEISVAPKETPKETEEPEDEADAEE
jgi:hypothetical protein